MKPRSLWAASVALLALLVALTALVKLSSTFGLADLQGALWVNGLQLGGALDGLLVSASLYGREYFWVGVVGVMLVFGDRRTRVLALGLSALFVVGIVAGEVAKEVVARPRPLFSLPQLSPPAQIISRLPPDTDFSFPSGHALIVSIGAFYSLATFRRRWVAWLLTAEAAVVCFSRVYVGAHFPSDVVGGVVLGALIVTVGLALEDGYLGGLASIASTFISKRLRDGPLEL